MSGSTNRRWVSRGCCTTEIYSTAGGWNRWMRHYVRLLHMVVENSDTALAQMNLRDDAERAMVNGWNDTAAPVRETTLPVLFEEQASRAPDAIALSCGGRLFDVCGALNRLSNRVARKLQSLGCGRGTLVPVVIDRSVEMVIAVMGVLKAGGAYVPVELDYPDARIEHIIQAVNGSVVLTNTRSAGRLVPLLERLLVTCLMVEECADAASG